MSSLCDITCLPFVKCSYGLCPLTHHSQNYVLSCLIVLPAHPTNRISVEDTHPVKLLSQMTSFMKKSSYECHMKAHSGENPQYMCDQCSQSYYNVFALKRHYMKHTSERRFVCDICNKAFWMKDALKVHKRSHANVKMFQCTQCSKAFAHKHTLVAHLRSHSSEQPFACNVCPKTFIYKYNLDRHQQHHSLPPAIQPLPPPPPAPLPLPPSLIMMAPPKHLEMPTLHIL
ncbi:hypothetical protein J6590_002532 [Homalodisca vitripennis]|nr:hypothetical protein J6590_002532 [Homalodisca vitripennis]